MGVKRIIWKKRHNLKGSSVILFTTMFLLSIVSMVPVAHADSCDGLVLWNKLGSDEEVLNSAFGPDLEFYIGGGSSPDGIANRKYVPAVFGNGVTIDTGNYYCMQRIRNIVLKDLPNYINPEQGTIETWYMQKDLPIGYDHNPYRLFDGPYGLGSGMGFCVNHDPVGGSHSLTLSLVFGGANSRNIWYDANNLPNNQWIHLAAVWDRSGIDETSETMRIYVDGNKIASGTYNDWGTSVGYWTDICGGNDQNIARKFKMDNLIIWNYAKTDFSDRFTESPFDETLIISCDSDGKEKNQFESGESVYVKGLGLEANTTYRILIQDDPVSEGDKLSADEDPSGPVLWNKLGSDSEVLNSEVGPNGTIVGPSYAYELAKYGNGYVRKAGGENCVQFPGSVLHNLNYRGTIELWVNPKVPHPVPYQYGFFALVGQPVSGPTVPENRGNIYLYWGDGVTGTGLYGGVRFDDSLAETPSESTQFVATVGVPFHAAICWDIDGIDGTGEKVRVYRDGVVVGSTTTPWNPSGTDLEDNFKLGMNPDAQGFDKFISDNIKVWNYTKTNFSDRFNETPSAFEDVTTDADGSFDPIEIWAIPSDANPTADAFDIVADKLDDDPNTGKYNAASDGIDSARMVGFVAPIPELPTIALFSVGLLVFAGCVVLRRINR